MKYIKRFIALISVISVLCLIIGCSAGTPEPEDDIPSASELPLPEEYTDTGSIDVIKTTMPKNPDTLHPIFADDEDTLNLLSLICEPAIALDYSDKPTASVIESWSFDETGKKATFTVRNGLKFHDGSDVTAYDLKYCLSLIMNASSDECIYSKYSGIVASYDAVDELTLTVNLTHKTGDIFYLMNFPVIPESVYSGLDKNTLTVPIGTGPYYVNDYSAENGMTLFINENWWRTAPSVKKIKAYPVTDNESKLAGYQLGNFNFVAMTSMTANSYSSQSNTTAYKTSTLYYETLVPNMNNRYLREDSVRQAISLALDRREIISTGVLGGGISSTTPIRTDLWYLEGTTSSLIEYDVSEAEKLLDSADCYLDSTNGLRYCENSDGTNSYVTLDLIYCEYDELYYRNSVVALIKSNLEDIGICVTVKELEREDYEQALRNGNFDLALACFYMNSNNDISFLFGADATCNYGGYYDGELQSLISEANSAITEEEQTEAYNALYNMLAERLPHIGLYYRQNIVYTSSLLENVKNLRRGAVFADINSWK